VKRLAALALLATLLLSGCAHTDRPEGVVERWLISLNQGKAGRPERYAPDSLSQRILPGWASRKPGDLDVIEVGKGTLYGPFPGTRNAAVPFKATRLDGWSITAVAELHRTSPSGWHIDAIGSETNFPSYLRVPSECGERIGSASFVVWLSALGVALFLILISAELMATVGRPGGRRGAEPA